MQLIRPSLSLVTVPTGKGRGTRTELGDCSSSITTRPHRAVSTLSFQPIVLRYLGHGFYVKSADSTWTRGWHAGDATTVPLSIGLGYVLLREGRPPINAFVSGEWMAYRDNAPVAPQTTVRFGLTVAFPDLSPW